MGINFWNQKWVRLLVSLLFSVSLFAYVNGTFAGAGTSRNPSRSLIATDEVNISVPVKIQYNADKYYVEGAPQKINVKVSGPSSLVLAASRSNSLTATLDLTKPKIGEQTVRVKLQGFSSSLETTPEVTKVKVNVTERHSKEIEVVSSYNQDNINEDYVMSSFKLSRNKVTISGPKDLVDSVESVVAEINIPKNTKASFNVDTKLRALDKFGNNVDVEINPESIKANFTIVSRDNDSSKDRISKTVSISPSFTGSKNPGNFNIRYSTQTVQISGAREDIENIDSISMTVNMDWFTNDGGSRSVVLDLPKGVSAFPNAVLVTITPRSGTVEGGDSQ